jgi:ABC-type transport system substrate-binding protein
MVESSFASVAALGEVQSFPEAFKAAHLGKLQFAGFGWSGDDPDDFMRLFYGPNSGAGNLARFRNAEFDALFEKTHLTAHDAERNRLYETMTKIVSARHRGASMPTASATPWRSRGYAGTGRTLTS